MFLMVGSLIDMTSIAQTIAEQFGGDGLNFETEEGETLEQVCEGQEQVVVLDRSVCRLYIFADGSQILGGVKSWVIVENEDDEDDEESSKQMTVAGLELHCAKIGITSLTCHGGVSSGWAIVVFGGNRFAHGNSESLEEAITDAVHEYEKKMVSQ